MKLTVYPRVGDKKSDVKKMRRESNIPAIIYSSKTQPSQFIVNAVEFAAILRQTKPGHLPTTIFTLTDGKKDKRAIIKDIQYHPTTYNVLHIDFEELHDKVPVNVKIPVSFTGVMDCIGVKLGGFLRQISRHVKVQCLPKDIPQEFKVDVQDLGIRQSRRLKDIVLPEGVRALASPDEVLVVIAKR